MSQAELHAAVAAAGFGRAEADYVLVTDGSGNETLGCTGWCCIILNEGLLRHTLGSQGAGALLSVGASSDASTDRAEFRALLDGLGILERRLGVSDRERELMRDDVSFRRRVFWITDRESLALSVARDANGVSYYKRTRERALWEQFEHYEKLFNVCPFFCSQKHPYSELLAICDRHASAARQLFVSYMNLNNLEQFRHLI